MSVVFTRAISLFAMAAPLAGCMAGYAPEPQPPRPVVQGDFEMAMLTVQNRARRDVGSAALVWDASLAVAATRYAEEMARSRRFAHSEQSTRPGQGENLFKGTRGGYSFAEMAQLWVDERRLYRDGVFPSVSSNGDWSDVAHYTQIVWRTTQRVGCGIASNGSDDYLVCRYTPQGNVVGERALG